MAELFNLRQARKQKARAEKEKKSAENRRLYGHTKAEKLIGRAERASSERRLDGHRLEKPDAGVAKAPADHDTSDK
jgi:hypothetical protein